MQNHEYRKHADRRDYPWRGAFGALPEWGRGVKAINAARERMVAGEALVVTSKLYPMACPS